MKETIKNPFLIAGYHSPVYFCDREKETEKIISALINDRSISLISPRRIGKTGLILHVFNQLSHLEKSTYCFYIDIFSTQNLHDFVEILGKSIIGELDNYSEAMVKSISSFFKSFRPSFTFDPITGSPTVSLNIQPEQTNSGLQEIFEYLKASGKRIYIAINEFQQILEYPEKGVEALLRSYMQFLPNMKFIFAGSKKHLMDTMFSSAKRPFYQSTQKIGLNEIPQDTYCKFATEIFLQHNKRLPPMVFEYIYQMLSGHTWYIQFVLNQLFSMSEIDYTNDDVNDVISEILLEENATYKTYCEVITKGQLRLLRAIAKEKKVYEPYEASFMRKYNLTAPSSVKAALSALIDKTLILKSEDDSYHVYDRFFSIWLAQ